MMAPTLQVQRRAFSRCQDLLPPAAPPPPGPEFANAPRISREDRLFQGPLWGITMPAGVVRLFFDAA